MTAPEYSSRTSITTYSTGSILTPSRLGDDDLRLADRDLVAFAAHRLDQDREMQFAAAADLERVGAVGVRDAQRDVRFELAHQPVADLARGEVLALAPGERRGVDHEEHRDGRFVDRDRGDALGDAASAIVSPMLRPSMPETQTMSPAEASSTSMRSRPWNVEQLREPQAALDLAVVRDLGDRRVDSRAAAEDAADADASDVLVVVDRADQHLEAAVFGRRFRDMLGRSSRRAARGRRCRLRGCTSRCPARPFV